jgi:SOS-response transcriptional repressor LexA
MLNEKHQLVLEFIRAYVRLHGVPPSYSVIARGLGLKSKSNIHRVIHILQDEGLLVIKPHKFNSIKLVDKTVKGVASL